MLTILLSSFGCHVVGAEDGERAMNVAERSRPDLILLDIKIPRLDGLAVARLIRSHPSLNKVPIVAVTMSNLLHTRQRISELLGILCLASKSLYRIWKH